MPRGIICASSGTKTSLNSRVRDTVPRMPRGSQSPMMLRPGAFPGTAMYSVSRIDSSGLSIIGDWDPLGMRGTVSRTLLFKDVFVPDEAQMMPRGIYFQAASRWPHMFTTLSPTYLGIAIAAYEFTVCYLRGEVEGMPPVKRRMYPTKQIAVAEMWVKLEQTRCLFLRMLEDARVDPPK